MNAFKTISTINSVDIKTIAKWLLIVVIGCVAIAFLGTLAIIGGFELIKSDAYKQTSTNDVVTYIASWIAIGFLSVAAMQQISEIVEHRKDNMHLKRANQIAMMVGLVLVIFLFKQPYLDRLFSGYETETMLQFLLFGGGAISGWLVWYLKNLKNYGEFFHVLLLTSVIGFCWYARLTAPEEVQLTAAAFILGSLFRIAKDYMDLAAKNPNEAMQPTPKPLRGSGSADG